MFGNDDQIEDFLQCKNDFECTNIDVENENVHNYELEIDSVNTVNTVDTENTVDLGESGDDELEAEVL